MYQFLDPRYACLLSRACIDEYGHGPGRWEEQLRQAQSQRQHAQVASLVTQMALQWPCLPEAAAAAGVTALAALGRPACAAALLDEQGMCAELGRYTWPWPRRHRAHAAARCPHRASHRLSASLRPPSGWPIPATAAAMHAAAVAQNAAAVREYLLVLAARGALAHPSPSVLEALLASAASLASPALAALAQRVWDGPGAHLACSPEVGTAALAAAKACADWPAAERAWRQMLSSGRQPRPQDWLQLLCTALAAKMDSHAVALYERMRAMYGERADAAAALSGAKFMMQQQAELDSLRSRRCKLRYLLPCTRKGAGAAREASLWRWSSHRWLLSPGDTASVLDNAMDPHCMDKPAGRVTPAELEKTEATLRSWGARHVPWGSTASMWPRGWLTMPGVLDGVSSSDVRASADFTDWSTIQQLQLQQLQACTSPPGTLAQRVARAATAAAVRHYGPAGLAAPRRATWPTASPPVRPTISHDEWHTLSTEPVPGPTPDSRWQVTYCDALTASVAAAPKHVQRAVQLPAMRAALPIFTARPYAAASARGSHRMAAHALALAAALVHAQFTSTALNSHVV